MRISCAAFTLMFASLAYGAESSPITGAWQTRCDGVKHLTISFTDDHSGQISSQAFSGDSCTSPTINYTIAFTFVLPHGAEKINAIDYTFGKQTATLSDQDTVDDFNEYADCGSSGWKINETRDISDLGCGFFDYTTDEMRFDLVSLATEKKVTYLAIGAQDDSHDGTTADRRPVTLDTTMRFFKK